jgi:Domain of unknown function (DUF4129)
MGGGKGARRILAGGLIGLALVAAVGLASRAHTPGAGGHARSISGDILLEYVLLVVAAIAIAAVPFWFYLFVSGRDNLAALPERNRHWMRSLLVTMAALSAAAAMIMGSGWLHAHNGANGNPLSALTGIAKGGSRAPQAVRFDWGPVIVVSTLAVLALIAGTWLVRQQRRAEPRSQSLAAEVALAVERTLADLRAEPDPRKAVIAAYAQMERALAEAGFPRGLSEAPREYLGRVLTAAGAETATASRLTELFERAKFSPHAIDESMKEDAIVALESLRDDLRSEL